MNIFEIMKLFRDFEKYDTYTRKCGAHDTKTQRFYAYLSKMKCVIDELQAILERHNTGIADNDGARISEHDKKALNKATTYYFKLEKRNTAAASA